MATWCEDDKQLIEYSRLIELCASGGSWPTHRLTPTLACSQLELLPLTPPATRLILASALNVAPETLEEATVRRAHKRSGGNPGFLFEFCNHLFLGQTPAGRNRGGDEDTINVAIASALERLPGTIKEIVLAELDRLPVPQQQLVKIAAAIGGPFEREMLIAIYPGPANEVDEALRAPAMQSYIMQVPRASNRGSSSRFYAVTDDSSREDAAAKVSFADAGGGASDGGGSATRTTAGQLPSATSRAARRSGRGLRPPGVRLRARRRGSVARAERPRLRAKATPRTAAPTVGAAAPATTRSLRARALLQAMAWARWCMI